MSDITKFRFAIVLVCIASITFSRTGFCQTTLPQQPNKKLLSAEKSNKPVPELSLATKKKANSADKKAPKMVLHLNKPTLEVLNHTLRILVTSDKNLFLLKGKASDKVSGVAAVFVGGKKVNVDAYGSFRTHIRLTKPYNVVKVVAIDHSGNREVKELAIRTTAPIVNSHTPAKPTNNTNEAERWVAPAKN